MSISPRNQILGTVVRVLPGDVDAVVVIDIGAGLVEADITLEALSELRLAVGSRAVVVLKASNVMFASGASVLPRLPSANQLVGKVSDMRRGSVNGRITLALADGTSFVGTITNESIEELGLEVGKPAVAIFRPADVMVITP